MQKLAKFALEAFCSVVSNTFDRDYFTVDVYGLFRQNPKGLFTSSESEGESEKDQRTDKRSKIKPTKIKGNIRFLFRFRSV